MTFFFGDGFDLYSAGVDAASYWDASSINLNNSSIVAGRFSGSRAWTMSNSSQLYKTSGVNDAVHHFSFAYMQTFALSGNSLGLYFTLYDGATAQCTVVFRSDGAILFTAGAFNGTVLATYLGAVAAINTWYAFEVEVVVNNTTGSIAVRKNGGPGNDFFLGSLNTRATANNYANKLWFSSNGGSQVADDFLWRSDAVSVPWAGDIRCYTRMPASDIGTPQWTRTGSSSQQLWGSTGITNALTANQCEYIQISSSRGGLLTSVSFSCTNGGGGTGHVKLALFSSVGNAVGVVLATSNEITNPGAAIITATFPTPPHMSAGTNYWIGIIQDASITYNVLNSSSAGVNVITLSTTPYASWPIPNPGGVIATINMPGSFTLYLTPGANADAVGESQQDAGATYVYSSTNGQADLYAIGSIPNVPVSILGVTTRGYFQKNDAGTRNAAVQLKSGATTVQSPSTALNTAVWGWIARNDLVDPATGAAWTAAGVNNAQIGPVVTA